MRTDHMVVFAAMMAMSLMFPATGGEWPILKTYKGEHLSRVKMPLGGIGTGTISISGRGARCQEYSRSIRWRATQSV